MYPSYGLGPVGKQPMLWQDRRDRSALQDRTEEQNWWVKFKKSISSSEPQPVPPTRIFSKEQGLVGGRMVMNIATPELTPAIKPHGNKAQLFKLDNQEEAPSRPQLNLRDINSQFRPLEEIARPSGSDVSLLRPPEPVSSSEYLALPPNSEEIRHPMLHYQNLQHRDVNQLKTSSETEIISPPSPFMDTSVLTRRKPPQVPQIDLFGPSTTSVPTPVQGEGRQRRKLASVSRPLSLGDPSNIAYSEQAADGDQKSHFVKDTVNLFEKKNPNSPYVLTEVISVKIPNKAKNARQRSRAPSRTPSDPDLSRINHLVTDSVSKEDSNQVVSAENRLSKSYEFHNTDRKENSHSRDRSISDGASLDSRLDSLEPQMKEKKASVLRGLINATRGKIRIDSQNPEGKSNTEPSRRKVKRVSSSVKPVKSEIMVGELGGSRYVESMSTNSSFGLIRKKHRKPRHLELQEGFDVKGFDNFMMY